jgi:energy-coupling factor transporter ATP-binding protein EcfA2
MMAGMKPDPSDVSYFARTNHRGGSTLFGIKRADRLLHMYVIGKTGVGKSTLLETLVNISKGQLGEDSALVLGGFIASTIGLAAFSRADTDQRRSFFLYMDEFQNFTTLMMANMMSELRKYGVGLVLAHQYLNQLDSDVRHAVLGNAGTLISFRVGAEDAPFLAKEFQPTFDVLDLLNLPNYAMYLRLMIDGTPSTPFSATSIRHSG